MIKEILEKRGAKIVGLLQENIKKKDLVATGRSLRSINSVATDSRLTIKGASHIFALEYGRGPAKGGDSGGAFLKNLEVWRTIRNVPQSAKTLQYFINKKGTLLWQGKDPRFQGNQSGAITEIVNDDLVKDISKDLTEEYTAFVRAEIGKVFKGSISI